MSLWEIICALFVFLWETISSWETTPPYLTNQNMAGNLHRPMILLH